MLVLHDFWFSRKTDDKPENTVSEACLAHCPSSNISQLHDVIAELPRDPPAGLSPIKGSR